MDQFMGAALEEARRGAEEGGIPIGAALVDEQGRLVATGRNRRTQDRAVVMHAEINCLFNAGKDVEDFRGMTIYSTLRRTSSRSSSSVTRKCGTGTQGGRRRELRFSSQRGRWRPGIPATTHAKRRETQTAGKGELSSSPFRILNHPENPAFLTPGGTEPFHHVRKCSNWRKAVHKKPGALVGAPPRPQAFSKGTIRGGP